MLVLILLSAISGCARDRPQPLATYTSGAHGFTVARPAAWERAETDDGRRVWFLPATPPAGEDPEGHATEFVVVMTLEEPGPLPEAHVRQMALTLLPMHGVSGFVRTPESTEEVVWYRFELTGSTRGIEWASLGLLVTGPSRLHYAVCASPLATFRERQRICADVLRSFKPGDLKQ
jgi:hypothetical protein